MKKSEKSKAELEIENELLRRGNLGNNLTSIVNNFFKYGCIVAVAFFTERAFAHIAGLETKGILNVDFNVSLMSNKYFANVVCIIFGISGAAYGVLQRRSKRKTIAHLSKRKEELERKVDPGRHSSSLMEDGTTRPEDE